MSYEKETWATGDTITAAKLNNMEDGIANVDPFIITMTEEGVVVSSDKTWREIYTAFRAGRVCIYIWDEELEDQEEQTYTQHRMGSIVGADTYGGDIGGEGTTYNTYLTVGSHVETWSPESGDPDNPISYSYD